MRSSFSNNLTLSTISRGERPNLDFEPEDSAHLPEPLVFNFILKPIRGVIFNFFAAVITNGNSALRSMTIKTFCPNFWPRSAVSMYS